jgi:3-hydroxyisobutyrate dehydrogenase-like beta-hydroxyacid dehydrogenase
MASEARVGIMSPGDMGGGIGKVLHEHGIDVWTSLEGRSDLTRLRAEEAGFRDAGSLDRLVAEVDMLLSVLVPAEARPLAESVAAAMQRTGKRPVFVECNAIAPQTVLEIERLVRASGADFIDAGIIGGPPRTGYSPHFHCSGPSTAILEGLRDHGLDIRVVGPKIGQASGLKMVYAASTKGTTALWTELLVASRALGLEGALREELGEGATARQQMNGIPNMPNRARRWVGEMEEIAATFAGLGMTPRILEGAADMYRLVGETSLADLTTRDPKPSLDDVLLTLNEHLGTRH